MKKVGLLLSLLMFVVIVKSQEKYLEIYNPELERTKTIEENKRVRLKTLDGKKFSGKLGFQDSTVILVRNIPIELDEVKQIKKNPLAVNIISKTALSGAGILMVGFGLLIPQIGLGIEDSKRFKFGLIIVSGVALNYAAFKGLNFIPVNSKSQGWKFQVKER